MNAIAKQTSAPAVPAATGGVNGLVPQSMDQAIRLADMMSRGRLVPKHLQDSPGDCLMVIEQAMRWNMSPFAVAQATSVIQGKMMFEGKVVAAAVQASSAITGWIDYEFGGENGGRYIVVKATRRGETEQKTVKVTLAEAKTTNQWWQKTPDQMLVYHGTRVWGRRWVPSVMLGVYSPEEMQQDAGLQARLWKARPNPSRRGCRVRPPRYRPWKRRPRWTSWLLPRIASWARSTPARTKTRCTPSPAARTFPIGGLGCASPAPSWSSASLRPTATVMPN